MNSVYRLDLSVVTIDVWKRLGARRWHYEYCVHDGSVCAVFASGRHETEGEATSTALEKALDILDEDRREVAEALAAKRLGG